MSEHATLQSTQILQPSAPGAKGICKGAVETLNLQVNSRLGEKERMGTDYRKGRGSGFGGLHGMGLEEQ